MSLELNYRVRPGDTLTLIAARFHTTVAGIAAASGIDPTNPIIIGSELRVPAGRGPAASLPTSRIVELHYRVRPGDTLTAIAARFDTTTAAIVSTSGIDPSEPILIGATLSVPAPVSRRLSHIVYYRVHPGDTLSELALARGISVGALADLNHLDMSAPLLIGTRLVLPSDSDSADPGLSQTSVRASLAR